jgi:hypothetical protein
MKQDSRTRLFEVMSRLDKTFTAPKTRLNEDFEPASPVAFKQPMGGEVGGEEKVEQTPEEKLEALTAKVDELYALLHGEEEEEEEEPEAEPETSEPEGMENLQEWNFDKKKGEKKDDDTKEHEDSETPAEEKAEHEEGGEEFGKTDESIESPAKPKIPVNMIAKVGK